MLSEYKTAAAEASEEYVVKKSRFIGYIRPVETCEQAADFIGEIRSKHWDATHNVYAYCLLDGQTRRYSDDGEPQGTAGMPTLEVLVKNELTNAAIVVTRYFGGILLGAGGLVRAYSHTAALAVKKSGIAVVAPCAVFEVRCDYGFYARLTAILESASAKISATSFTDSVSVTAHIRQKDYESLCEDIIDKSLGKFSCRLIGQEYCKI